jgi:hypothetical protein
MLSDIQAKELVRSDYKITIPDSCTLDPAEPDIDLDHMTTINFPNDNTMGIMVMDDKTRADQAVKKIIADFKLKMKSAIETSGAYLTDRGGSYLAVRGLVNGVSMVFEVRLLKGKNKAIVIMTTSLESEKTLRDELRKSAETIAIKE